MKKAKNKLDAVIYLCDYLPELVFIKHAGFKIPFKLYIEKNGGKGLSLAYQYYSDFLLAEDAKKIEQINKANDENLWWGIRKKFNAPMECLYLCEYIRSVPELELAFKQCYKFLRKHKLISRREQNTRASFKLFRAIDGQW